MVGIVLTPDWFLGKDVLIEAFSFIVLAIFSVLAVKNYRLNRNRNFLYIGIGFTLIAIAQLATILTKLVLYYDFGPSQAIGQALVTSGTVSSVDFFYSIGFFFHRFLTLLGVYIIYRLPRARKSAWDYVLVAYFIVISAFITNNVANIFHLTSFVILLLIVGKYHNVYLKNNFLNTRILLFAFGILAFSQLLLIFSGMVNTLDVVGNLFELISYTILLGLVIRILKHGKKKKSYGHHLRYVGDNPGKRRKH